MDWVLSRSGWEDVLIASRPSPWRAKPPLYGLLLPLCNKVAFDLSETAFRQVLLTTECASA